MSAYIVDAAHITALAAYAGRHNIMRFAPCDVQQIGDILHAENVRSVNHRYPGDDAEPSFTPVAWAEWHIFTPIEIIKAADCLEYQSCEHPEWRDSEAADILRHIKARAIYELAGYREAAWHIQERPAQPRIDETLPAPARAIAWDALRVRA